MAEWISVRDRLPETATICVVLVCGNSCIMEYLYDNDRGFWNGELRDKPVTHWMPLPQPPGEQCDTERA